MSPNRCALILLSTWLAAGLSALAPAAAPPKPAGQPPATTEPKADIAIYGATPAGIAAAVAAAESGSRVVLIEPTGRIGGMVTNGLSHTDFRTFEGLTGRFLQFTRRVEAYYRDKYGQDSQEARDSFRGTHGEPHVNRLVFQQMLAEQPRVRLLRRRRLLRVEMAQSETPRIAAAVFARHKGQPVRIAARVFIDSTYEGDLLAAAGVPFRVGREGRHEYGESLAPAKADGQLQGYNFRLIMTRDPKNRAPVKPPAGYRREEFLGLLPLLESGKFKSVFCRSTGGIYKAQNPHLPRGKYDVNDVSRAPVRLSLPEINNGWPTGDAATRRRIFQEHLRHNVGMLYFLQNDKAVPAKYQAEARQWGFCKDEFVENEHLPEQLYVREARRMVGGYVFTQKDTEHAPGDTRARLHKDAIAMGDYGPNCHGTAHEGPRFGGRHTGEFYQRAPPYQIPYGVLVPKKCENLLAPVACSASHVGFCALRLEPIWTSLGEAAGFAAHLAVEKNLPVQRVPVAEIQRRLHAAGAATIYVSDVPPGSPDFAAVQWWALRAGLHGLAPQPKETGQRGEHLLGQYFRAFPNHAAQLEKPLDNQLAARWLKLAEGEGVSSAKLREEIDGGAIKTRGEFIRAVYALGKARHEP